MANGIVEYTPDNLRHFCGAEPGHPDVLQVIDIDINLYVAESDRRQMSTLPYTIYQYTNTPELA